MITQRLNRNIRLGVKNLLLHKLRSLLTMLGVVFGVGSVVAMLAIGEGASQEAMEQIRRLGSQNILVSSVKPSANETTESNNSWIETYGLTRADEQRILDTMPTVNQAVPAKVSRRRTVYKDRMYEVRLVGTNASWFDLVRREIAAGRPLLHSDVSQRTAVCVITEEVARRLLAATPVLGEDLYVGNQVFTVVGVTRGAQGAGNVTTPDTALDIYIPISTYEERFIEFTLPEREKVELNQLIVQVGVPGEEDSTVQVEPTAEAIRAMLKRFHTVEDYQVSVPLTLLKEAENTKRTFNIVLGSIAGISLLVGGIGIMNIMLASVTERTREIGIRRAVGARRDQIVLQFLVETVVLSLTGGALGILLGLLIPWLVMVFAGMPTVVTMGSLILAVAVSCMVGIVFGIYPAYRAASLDPINALRHE